MRVALLYPMTAHLVARVAAACMRNDWDLVVASPHPDRWAPLLAPHGYRAVGLLPISGDLAGTAGVVGDLDPDCVVPGGEFSTVRTDEVARCLSLPGGDPERMRGLRDKAEMRSLFERYGVPQPRVLRRLSCSEPPNPASLELDYPVIVKPVDMAGSMFVRICHDPADVARLLREIDGMHASTSTGLRFARRALVEEIAVGPEYSSEVVVEGGTLLAGLLTTKYLSTGAECNEVAHLSGAELDAATAAEVRAAVEGVVRSSGLTDGVFHVEFRLTSDGPRVIEAAPRVAGDRISELVELRHGWHLEEALIRTRAGLPVSPAKRTEADEEHYYGVTFLFGEVSVDPPPGVELLWQEASAARPQAPAGGTRVEARTATLLCRSTDLAVLDGFLGRRTGAAS